MQRYEIAGLNIDIDIVDGEKSYIVNRMKIFEKEGTEYKADMNIKVFERDFIDFPKGKTQIEETINLNWVEKIDGSGFYGYKARMTTGEILDMFETDKTWQNSTIYRLNANYYSHYHYNPIEVIAFHLIGTILRTRILYHDGIVIHASSIVHAENGIIFSAPSGTGKSTHVSLWEKYYGAQVLNDDTPVVRLVDGKPYVYGSPWSGSSDKFLNKRAPLSAIFILEQAPVNEVKMLNKQEIVMRLMPRLFMPYFNSELMELAVTNFEKLIPSVPVYLLKCRPDKEAVELVAKCV